MRKMHEFNYLGSDFTEMLFWKHIEDTKFPLKQGESIEPENWHYSKPEINNIKEMILFNNALSEWEKEYYLKRLKKSRGQKIKEQRFTITGIDVPKLVTELERRCFFDASYKKKVLAWFNGMAPEEPIPMNGTATRFISLIADMLDTRPKFITNTKEFVYLYIESSFLFNGKNPQISTIKQIMKPGINKNRVSHLDNSIPDIQTFRK